MNALIFTVRYNIALWLGAGEHLFHVAPADLLQRLSRQDMHMPGLGVHGRWRALGDRDDLLDHGARHRLGFEATHTSARVYKLFKIHCGCSWVWPGGGACIKYIESGMWTFLQVRASSHRAGPPVMPGRRFLNLVLRLGFEIAGVVTFVQLTGKLTPGAVDHPPPLHGRTLGDGVGPALHVCVLLYAQEFAATIEQALRQTAIPGPD